MRPEATKAALRPKQSGCRPAVQHVTCHVPALHVFGFFSPFTHDVLDRIRARQRHIECCWLIELIDFAWASSHLSPSVRVAPALRSAINPVDSRTLFFVFSLFSLTEAAEEPLTFRSISPARLVCDVSFKMDDAGLLQGRRKSGERHFGSP